MSVSSLSQQAGPTRSASSKIDVWIGLTLIVLLLGFALWMRALLPMNTDTSWLITVSEMVLDGKTLYVDVSETNPPASIWIYLPIVALARLLRIAPEPAVIAWVFVLMAISLSLTAAILARVGWIRRYEPLTLGALAIAVLAILPGNTFSEREHVATLLALPFLAATMARVNGQVLSWPLLAAAGLCGGMVVIIKPHFVLGLELPVLLALSLQRRWQTLLSPENVVAGVLTIVYVGSTFVFYPEYWTVTMPVNKAIYLPVANQWEALQSVYVPVLIGMALMAALFCGRQFLRHPMAIAFAAAAGFCIAFIIQGKLWAYQIYPAISFGLMGAALAAFDRDLISSGGRYAEFSPFLARQRLLRFAVNPALSAAVALWVCAPLFFVHLNHDKLAEAITKIHPRPVLAVVSGDIALGHPTMRLVQGQWGMTQWALWIETYGLRLRHRYRNDPSGGSILRAVEGAEMADMATFLADLRRNHPDILLTFRAETALRAHVRTFPGIAEELDRYELVDTVPMVGQSEGLVDVLRRRQDAPRSDPKM